MDNPIAIDLLCGDAQGRLAIESGLRPADLLAAQDRDRKEWEEKRESVLLY